MEDIHNTINNYFELQDKIYKYFKYEEDWCVIPIDDCREYCWQIVGYGVKFWPPDKKDEVYENSMYAQNFSNKWVYRGKDLTMICCNTHTDGNKFLCIFSNNLEIERGELL